MGMLLPARALFISLGLHLALGYGALTRASREQHSDTTPSPDLWSGNAVEVESVETERALAEPAGEARATSGSTPAPLPPPAPARAEAADDAPDAPDDQTPTVPARVPPARRESQPAPPKRADAATTRVAIDSGSSSEAIAPGGVFGAAGLPAGVRHLPKAFARALPEASKADPAWHTLPLGAAGQFEIEFSVDDEGRLGDVAYPSPEVVRQQPPALRRMVERTLLLLKSGTFSLAPSARQSGKQRLKLAVEISRVEPSVDDFAKPEHARQHGRVPGQETPSLTRPAHCFWIYNSGRRVDVRVWLRP